MSRPSRSPFKSLNNTLDTENNRSLKSHPVHENVDKLEVSAEDTENSLNLSGLAQELSKKLILGTPKQEQSSKFNTNKWASPSRSANDSLLSTSGTFSPSNSESSFVSRSSVSSSETSFVTARDSLTSNTCTSPNGDSEIETITVADGTIDLSSDSADTLNFTLDESIIPKDENKYPLVKQDPNKTVVDDFEIVDIDCDKEDLKSNFVSEQHEKVEAGNVDEHTEYINSSVVSQDVTYLSAEESVSEEGTSRYASLENIYNTVLHQSHVDDYEVSVVGLNDITRTADYSVRNFSTTTFPNQSCVDQYIEEITVVEPINTTTAKNDVLETNNPNLEKSYEGIDSESLNSSNQTINESHITLNNTTSSHSDVKSPESLNAGELEKSIVQEQIYKSTGEIQIDEINQQINELNLNTEFSVEEIRASGLKLNSEVNIGIQEVVEKVDPTARIENSSDKNGEETSANEIENPKEPTLDEIQDSRNLVVEESEPVPQQNQSFIQQVDKSNSSETTSEVIVETSTKEEILIVEKEPLEDFTENNSSAESPLNLSLKQTDPVVVEQSKEEAVETEPVLTEKVESKEASSVSVVKELAEDSNKASDSDIVVLPETVNQTPQIDECSIVLNVKNEKLEEYSKAEKQTNLEEHSSESSVNVQDQLTENSADEVLVADPKVEEKVATETKAINETRLNKTFESEIKSADKEVVAELKTAITVDPEIESVDKEDITELKTTNTVDPEIKSAVNEVVAEPKTTNTIEPEIKSAGNEVITDLKTTNTADPEIKSADNEVVAAPETTNTVDPEIKSADNEVVAAPETTNTADPEIKSADNEVVAAPETTNTVDPEIKSADNEVVAAPETTNTADPEIKSADNEVVAAPETTNTVDPDIKSADNEVVAAPETTNTVDPDIKSADNEVVAAPETTNTADPEIKSADNEVVAAPETTNTVDPEIKSADNEVVAAPETTNTADPEIKSADNEVVAAPETTNTVDPDIKSADNEVVAAPETTNTVDPDIKSADNEVVAAPETINTVDPEIKSVDKEVVAEPKTNNTVDPEIKSADNEVVAELKTTNKVVAEVKSADNEVITDLKTTNSVEPENKSDDKEVVAEPKTDINTKLDSEITVQEKSDNEIVTESENPEKQTSITVEPNSISEIESVAQKAENYSESQENVSEQVKSTAITKETVNTNLEPEIKNLAVEPEPIPVDPTAAKEVTNEAVKVAEIPNQSAKETVVVAEIPNQSANEAVEVPEIPNQSANEAVEIAEIHSVDFNSFAQQVTQNTIHRKKSLPKEPFNPHNDSLGEFELAESQLISEEKRLSERLKEEKELAEDTKEVVNLSGHSDRDLLENEIPVNLMEDENLNKSEAGPNTAELSKEDFQTGEEWFKDPGAFDFLANRAPISESELRKQSLYVQFDPFLKSPVRQKPSIKSPPIQNIMEEESLNDSAKLLGTSELNESVNSLSIKENESLNGNCATSTPSGTAHTANLISPERNSTSDEKDKLIEKLKKENASYQKMLNDYENTITQCVNQRENDKKQFEKYKKELEKEKEEVQLHLRNSEIAFNDVHLKYERSKVIIEGMKANEDHLRARHSELEEELKKQVNKYDALKTHAISQLEKANQDLDLRNKTYEMETTKLKAMLKKSEMQITSLQESLARKTEENAELTSICDDLISKVGPHA